jgi:hypothetical protein
MVGCHHCCVLSQPAAGGAAYMMLYMECCTLQRSVLQGKGVACCPPNNAVCQTCCGAQAIRHVRAAHVTGAYTEARSNMCWR